MMHYHRCCPKVVDKPDGRTEKIIYHGAYMVKRLTIPEGVSTSTHFHYGKTETLIVLKGTVLVEFVDGPPVRLAPGDTLTIEAGRKNAHRMTSPVGCGEAVYFEASTPHPDDSERVTT